MESSHLNMPIWDLAQAKEQATTLQLENLNCVYISMVNQMWKHTLRLTWFARGHLHAVTAARAEVLDLSPQRGAAVSINLKRPGLAQC